MNYEFHDDSISSVRIRLYIYKMILLNCTIFFYILRLILIYFFSKFFLIKMLLKSSSIYIEVNYSTDNSLIIDLLNS